MKLRNQLMYSSAYLSVALTTQTLVTWYSFYYAPPDKEGFISIALIGYALLIGRIVDAVADPLVAYWSDNSTHRSGRRIPFIKYGSLPLVLSFILIWFPIVGRQSIYNFYYLAIMMSTFFFFFTVVVAPYLALLPEISPDPDERITVSTYQTVANILGLIMSSTLAGILINKHGYRIMGPVLGLISLIFFYMPVLAVKEKQHVRSTDAPGFLESCRLVLKNRNFVFYQIANLLLWFTVNMLTIAAPYIGSVLMGLDEQGSGLMLGGTFLAAVAVSPAIMILSKKYGKKKIFNISMILAAFILSLIYLIGRPYLFFDKGWFGFAVVALAGVPISSIFIIPNAIIADITDQDTYETGQERQAMFFGIQGLANKMVIGLSSWFTLSILFNLFGYNKAEPGGIYLTAPIAGILCIIAFLAFNYGYDLDEEQVREIREKIQ
ncbi:MAG: MFS transporter [Halanaerobiaceae bacterium]|nr:MFS transporter [Halanaerobiaceae bacterium]